MRKGHVYPVMFVMAGATSVGWLLARAGVERSWASWTLIAVIVIGGGYCLFAAWLLKTKRVTPGSDWGFSPGGNLLLGLGLGTWGFTHGFGDDSIQWLVGMIATSGGALMDARARPKRATPSGPLGLRQ